MGIHGVRRPWSSFVSRLDLLPFYGVDPAPLRRGRAGSALGARASYGLLGRSSIWLPLSTLKKFVLSLSRRDHLASFQLAVAFPIIPHPN